MGARPGMELAIDFEGRELIHTGAETRADLAVFAA
jgi:hypothetical protein